jgi:serine protease Do
MCVHLKPWNICRLGLARMFIAAAIFAFLLPYNIGEGWAETGFSGMFLQGLDKRTARALEMIVPKGVLVRDIAVGGPANMGGVMRGDLIINYAGENIGNFEDLVLAAAKTKPGQDISVEIIRYGKQVQLNLVLEKRPASWLIEKGSVITIPATGLTLAAMTDEIRKRFNLRWGSTGVLVTLVEKQHVDYQFLERGDLIVQVNQEDVWQPSQLLRKYNEAKEYKQDHILLLVEREGRFLYLLQEVHK